jgi:hypothetical protein
MVEFRDYDDPGELIVRCVTCDEEILPRTVEYCWDCLAFTHGDECLVDHRKSALPQSNSRHESRPKAKDEEKNVALSNTPKP